MQMPRFVQGSVLAIFLAYSSSALCADNGAIQSDLPSQPDSDPGDELNYQISNDQRDSISRALLNQIGPWLVANFGLPAAKQLPDVKFVSESRLVEIRYHNRQQAEKMSRGRGAASGKDKGSIVALYDSKGPTIYLSSEWRGHDPKDVSTLVHEMVHHLQHLGRQRFDCPEAREGPAYAAQERWLLEHGSSLAAAFGVDRFTVLARSTCIH